MITKVHNKMIRFGEKHDVSEILPRVQFGKKKDFDRQEIDGEMVYFSSERLQVFALKGCNCSECGIEGKFFAIEKSNQRDQHPHLNLYAIDENGEEVLMTKDHIIPKSLGGKDCIENYQTMCKVCNEKKGVSVAE